MHGNPAEREHAGAKAVGNGGRSRDGAEHELGQPVKRGDQFVRVLSRSGPDSPGVFAGVGRSGYRFCTSEPLVSECQPTKFAGKQEGAAFVFRRRRTTLSRTPKCPLYLAIAGHEAVGEPIGGWEPTAPQGQ